MADVGTRKHPCAVDSNTSALNYARRLLANLRADMDTLRDALEAADAELARLTNADCAPNPLQLPSQTFSMSGAGGTPVGAARGRVMRGA